MADREQYFYRAMYDIARTINSSLDLNDVLQRVAKSATDALSAKASSIRLLNRERNRLLFGASYGLSEQYLRKGAIEVEKGGVDQEVLAGQTVTIADATNDPRFQYPERAREEGIRTVLVVPLTARGDVIGVMRVYTGEPREFSEEEIEFLHRIADLSAVAIDNARLYQLLKGDYETVIAFQQRLYDL